MFHAKKCIVCEGKNLKRHIESVDFSVSKEVFQIVKCESCNFVFTNPRPFDINLSKYYISDNYISHTDSNKGVFEKIYQIIRKFAIRQKFRLITSYVKTGEILDIGCGTGDFLNKCKQNNWNTTGIEPSKIAREKAISNYSLNIKESTELNYLEGEFDIITMWHVLEHVTELNQTIIDLNKILNDNGNLVIAVPNLNSYDASYYQKYWAAYDLPIHLYHFTEETITRVFQKHKFKLVKSKGMVFDSFYVSLLSEEYKSGSKNFIKAMTIGLISNIVAIFTNRGFSSTIYVFEKENT